MSRRKTVLVTGCSAGGLGVAFAQAFQGAGCHVFATARNPSKIPDSLTSLPHVEVLALDVTSAESISSCVSEIKTRTENRLDVLVNNAGWGILMPLLDTSIEEAKGVFDVNFWGVLAMVKACAPLLINARGVVVNISSIAGVLALPWQAIYNSSKAAVTMLSENLRLELQPLGVRVIVAMVGAVKTEIYNKQDFQLPASSLYGAAETAMQRQATGQHQKDTEETADVTAANIVRDVLDERRTGKIWRGGKAGTAQVATWLLPTTRIDKVLTRSSGFPELREVYKGGVPPQS